MSAGVNETYEDVTNEGTASGSSPLKKDALIEDSWDRECSGRERRLVCDMIERWDRRLRGKDRIESCMRVCLIRSGQWI